MSCSWAATSLRGRSSTCASTPAGTGSSATSRIASMLARSPGPAVSVLIASAFAFPRVSARPRYVQLPQRGDLVEGHRLVAVKVKQREERGHDLVAAGRARRQPPEGGTAELAEHPGDLPRLLLDADRRGVDVLGGDLRRRLGRERERREPGGLGRPQAEQHLGQQLREAGLKRD